MSLNWNISKIKNYTSLCLQAKMQPDGTQADVLKPVTEGLIWATMLVDMGSITEQNWQEFYARLSLYEKLFGPMLVGKKMEMHDIRNHIGLWTNVSTQKTDKWMKRMWSSHYDAVVVEEERLAATLDPNQ